MDEYIELSHGAGGLKMDVLLHAIQECFEKRVVPGDNLGMDAFDDGAIIKIPKSGDDIVLTTDGHTVDPLFFPGGNIGSLCICGTLNDLVMMGAEPIALTDAIILEEGFPFKDLERILKTMNEVCITNNVPIITGDTKVVPKGKIDKIMIATTGFGYRVSPKRILDSNVQVGDKIIVTGPVGSHGIAVMAFREGLEFQTMLQSDVAALAPLLLPIIKNIEIHAMKDPTRGGLASAINEWAEKSQVEIHLQQDAIPIDPAVQSAADMLGLDPLEITCEGRAIMAVPEENIDTVLHQLHEHPLGSQAAIIGEVKSNLSSKVFMETSIGGLRRLQKPLGELIPRVC